jgi:cyclic beta-1,2-glucan synthetase
VMAFAALGQGDKAWSLFSRLNPINHARSRAAVHRYKVEPYVVAADVYAAQGHVGRGGWTWYTGSASWMQRAGLESILGVRRKGRALLVDPCIPGDWPGFKVTIRYGAACYELMVENPQGVMRGVEFATIDGHEILKRPLTVNMVDDGQTHHLQVRLGPNGPKTKPRPRKKARTKAA